MEHSFISKVEVRWSDLDPNFHVRHSVYYDFAAYSRIAFLNQHNITAVYMMQNNFGPILFREECVFRKEIMLADELSIHTRLLKARQDFSRWSIVHEFFKSKDVLAARVTVDGAWIDTIKRKLTILPADLQEGFGKMHRDEAFEWIN